MNQRPPRYTLFPYTTLFRSQKAQEHGYHPEIILAGRRMNDGMGEYIASQIVKLMIRKGISVLDSNLLMLDRKSTRLTQSRPHLVCRLLLEKKKKKKNKNKEN